MSAELLPLPEGLRTRVYYMHRDFDLSTMERTRFWARECRDLVGQICREAQRAEAERDAARAEIAEYRECLNRISEMLSATITDNRERGE